MKSLLILLLGLLPTLPSSSFIEAGQTGTPIDQSQVFIQTPNATVVDVLQVMGETTQFNGVNINQTKTKLFADLANIANGNLVLVNGVLTPATGTPVPDAALAAVLHKYGVSVIGPDGSKLF